MKSVIYVLLSGVVLTTMPLAAIAETSLDVPFKVAAAGSCKAWSAICAQRGGKPALCSSKYAECVQSGCWTEGPSYGNVVHCGLKK